MAELIDITNIILLKKGDWSKITNEEKEKNFFIINRYLSKKYLLQAQLLNTKGMDKVLGMNLWFHFMKTKPYPKSFWSKSNLEKSLIAKKDYNMLLSELNIKPDDLNYLIDKNIDFIKEELLYLNKLKKI
jgi:hypothetical protein